MTSMGSKWFTWLPLVIRQLWTEPSSCRRDSGEWRGERREGGGGREWEGGREGEGGREEEEGNGTTEAE